jgi:hypothetical protein
MTKPTPSKPWYEEAIAWLEQSGWCLPQQARDALLTQAINLLRAALAERAELAQVAEDRLHVICRRGNENIDLHKRLEFAEARVRELERAYETCFKERQAAELKLQCVTQLDAATVAKVEAKYLDVQSDGRSYIFPLHEWSHAAGEVAGAATERAAVVAWMRAQDDDMIKQVRFRLVANAIESGAHRKESGS